MLNDGGGGIFGLLEQGAPEHAGAFERVFGTPHPVDLAALAAATGVAHTRVDDLSALAAALEPRPGMRLVEVRADRTTLRAGHAACPRGGRGGPVTGRRGGAAAARQGLAHRHELRRRLPDLGVGVRVGHHPAAGEQPGHRAVELGTPQRHPQLAVAVGVHPAHGPGVPTAVHALELGDQRQRGLAGRAAHRGRRVHRRGEAQQGRGVVAVQLAVHVAGQVRHVVQRDHPGGVRHVQLSTQRPQRGRERLDRQCVLAAVLLRRQQSPRERRAVRGSARLRPGGAGQHPRRDRRAAAPHQQLRSGTDQPVDGERPARRVAPRQAVEQEAWVQGGVGDGQQVVRERRLLQLTGRIRRTASATAAR